MNEQFAPDIFYPLSEEDKDIIESSGILKDTLRIWIEKRMDDDVLKEISRRFE